MKLQIRCLVFVDGRKDEGNTTRKEGTLHVRHCPFPAWVGGAITNGLCLRSDLGLGSPNPTTLLPTNARNGERVCSWRPGLARAAAAPPAPPRPIIIITRPPKHSLVYANPNSTLSPPEPEPIRSGTSSSPTKRIEPCAALPTVLHSVSSTS